MSGLDNIISRLESDCDEQCRRILADGEAQANALLKNAEKESRAECEKIVEDARRQAELTEKKAVSASALAARRKVLEAKLEILDETLESAVHKLRKLDTPSYFAVLSSLVKKYSQKGEGVLFLSESDLARMPEDFPAKLEHVSVSGTPADIPDGFILKYGDIEANCTFDAMLNASRDDLKATAGAILFG